MIDWVTAILPFSSTEKLIGGKLASIKSDGEVEWETLKHLPVVGSHDSKFHLLALGDGRIRIHGNPAKFLQGHNLFGTDDLKGLVFETMMKACKLMGIQPSLGDRRAWKNGDYELFRVDITYMYSLASRSNVRAWLRSAEYQSKSRHGRPIMTGGTLYWGKHSRRWAMKAYGKGDEIDSTKDHRLPNEILNRQLLSEYADDKLRLELVLRSQQLTDLFPFKTARQWAADTPAKLHALFLGAIDMSNQFTLTHDEIDGLPARLVAVYRLWKSGEDLRSMYPKNTFYRYRRQLLEHDIDIALIQPKSFDNVVPLVRALRPQAMAEVPEWAKGTSLYFRPTAGKAA